MKMNSLKALYRTTLSITLLFAASNLFNVFALTAQRPTDQEKHLQVKIDEKKQTLQDNVELTLGKPIERQLAGNEAHSYKISLAANQYLHVVVEQRGIDVVVALFAPDGKKMAEVDSPNGTQGPELISVVAEVAGSYRLEVRSLEAASEAGRYQAKIEELRTANSQDKIQIAAQQLLAEGAQLEIEGSAGSLRKAIDKYQEALPLWRAANNRAKEAETLYNMGFAYTSLGERQKALNFYDQSLPLFRAVGDRSSEANTLNDIGLIYDLIGEKQKALDFYDQSLTLLRAVRDRSSEAITLINIGSLYLSLGEQQKALDLYNRAAPMMRAAGDRRGEANALHQIGFVYQNLGEKQKALDFYNQDLLIVRAVEYREGEASTLNNIGLIYQNLGEKKKALDFYNQSLTLKYAGSDSGTAKTLNNIGSVYHSLGEQQKALDYYNQALPMMRAIEDREGESITLKNIAKVERDHGNLTEARVRIEAALTIIESLRTKIAGQELRSSYFATVQDYYDFYIDLLMRLHQQQPSAGFDGIALQASERGRARSLLETLAEANAEIRQGVNPVLLEQERSIQLLLAGKSERLTRISSDEQLKDEKAVAEKEVNELVSQYQEVRAQIRVKSPRYAALTQPVPSNLAEIQKLLDKDTVLLEYALGEERSYLWVITPQSLKSYELPKRAQIEESANRFIAAITIRGNMPMNNNVEYRKWQSSVKQADAGYPKLAAELSKVLLGQISSEIEGKRLLIVGDGVLQYVPFAALPKPFNANMVAAVGEPLVASNEIVNLPSASTLSILRREETARRDRKPYTKTVAVFADPVFDADDRRVSALAVKSSLTRSKTIATRGQVKKANRNVSTADLQNTVFRSAKEVGLTDRGRLKRLVESKNEAAAIGDAASTGQATIAMGFDASRERVMTSNLAEYRIVHFATHGLLNEENPELSGVVFSLVDEQGKEQNGFLRLHEIFNLNLPVEMVVLSACQTGLGKKIKGEGLVGLTRGFMYAGAPRVVASLWSVDDRATALLMSVFYRKMLREKLSPAAALRAAQNEIRGQKLWRSPVYWAGFVLQGEWRNIAPTRK